MGEPARSVPARVALFAGRGFVALFSVAVLAVTAYGWAKKRDYNAGLVTTDVISSEVAEAAEGPKPLDGAVDILLVGLDSRTDARGNPLPREVLDMLHAGNNDGERNTDTMILVHIPSDGRRAVAISFPRDSWVEIAGGFGKHRINSAFAYAYNDKARELAADGVTDQKRIDAEAKVAGRKNLIATIEGLIGRPGTIDRYAEVNLLSFYEITKAIGGVEVCLNNAVKEPKSGVDLPAGRQTIEGVQALAFVRQRHELPGGDLDRIVRQQVFIGALAHKVLSTGTLTNITKLDELVGAIQKSVVLSQGWDIATFAQQMQGLSSGAIDFRTIPTQGGARIGGADVLRVDPKEVRNVVGGLIDEQDSQSAANQPGPTPSTSQQPDGAQVDPAQVTVDVRNASKVRGQGPATLNSLTAKGFRAGQVNDTATPQSISVISYVPGDEAAAQRVADELGAPLFQLQADRTLAPGTVRVVLGLDYPQSLNRASAGTDQATTPDAAVPSSTGPSTTGPSTTGPSGSQGPTGSTSPAITADGVTCVN